MLPKRTTLLGLMLCVLAPLAADAAPARKQRGPDIQGTYALDAAASDDVKKAIDAATKEINWVKRGFVVDYLKKNNVPYQRVVIRLDACVTQVSVATDEREPILTCSGGAPVEWTREDKAKFKVSTLLKDGQPGPGPRPPEQTFQTLEQTFRTKDGQRVNTYRIAPDGKTLTLEVVITSPQLPRPLTYKLVYKRIA